MRSTTARAYLDGMSADKFVALVVPHLETRSIGGELRYTRNSIDAWIERGGRAKEAQTSEELGRLLDDDDDLADRRQTVR